MNGFIKQTFIFFFLLFFLFSTACNKSKNSGGTTGGNPVSSLPAKVSMDIDNP